MYDTSSSASHAASPLPCTECSTRGVCLPAGMSDADCARVSGLVLQQHHLLRGDALQSVNEPVHGRWYAIRSGQFKSFQACLLYTSPSPRDQRGSRMPSSA